MTINMRDSLYKTLSPTNIKSNLYTLKIKEIWCYLKSEDIGFWLLNIYFFFEYVRPQTIYPVIDVLPYTRISLILSIIACLFGKNKIPSNRINILIISFFSIIVISSLTGLDFGNSVTFWLNFIQWMLVYYIVINTINTERRFLIFLLAFLLYNFKMAQFAFRGWASIGFGFGHEGTGGGPGWFFNAGEFAIQMCIFFSLSLYFYLSLYKYWTKIKKGVFALFPIFAISGIASSSSRGAVLGVVFSIILIFFKSKYKFKALFFIALLGFTLVSILPTEMKSRFDDIGKDRTSLNRVERWEKGIEMVKRYPLFGVGYENWALADVKLFGGSGAECHNIFIECATELGTVGLAFFILMIIYTLILNKNSRNSAQKKK